MNLLVYIFCLLGQINQPPPVYLDPEFIFDFHKNNGKEYPYLALVEGSVQSISIKNDSFFIHSELCLKKQIVATVKLDSVWFSIAQTPIDTVFDIFLDHPTSLPPVHNIWKDSSWVFKLDKQIADKQIGKTLWKGKTYCLPPPFKDALNFLLNCKLDAPSNQFSEYTSWIKNAKAGKQVFQAENLQVVAHFNKDGKLEGSYKVYDNFNTLIIDGQFKNGKINGKWWVGELSICLNYDWKNSQRGSYYESTTYWFDNGNFIKEEVSNKVYQGF